MPLLLVIIAGVCFVLAILSAVLPIPHPVPLIAAGLLFELAAGFVRKEGIGWK